MIEALFDNKRRKAVQDAIRKGDAGIFRRSKPKAYEEPADDFGNLSSTFKGVICIGTPVEVGGYRFEYARKGRNGTIYIDAKGSGDVERIPCPMTEETRHYFVTEGQRVRIFAHAASAGEAQVTISLESLYVKGGQRVKN